MSSPLLFEQLAKLRQDTYQLEATAERLARQAPSASAGGQVNRPIGLRVRLAAWLYALADRLAAGTADVACNCTDGATMRAG